MPVSFSLLYYFYRVARGLDSQSFGTLTGGRILVDTSFVGTIIDTGIKESTRVARGLDS